MRVFNGSTLIPQDTCPLHTAATHLGPTEYVTLNNLQDVVGATHKAKRVGRGIGSGLGKTAGRGHKGQKARTGRQVKAGFEGGQTPLKQRVPKRGFHNNFAKEWTPLDLGRLQAWVLAGRLNATETLTLKHLRDSGVIHKRVKDGVKLLGQGREGFRLPLHLQVSQVSASARSAVEASGGSVTTVYYNALGLRALLQPDWFPKKGRLLPRPARPPQKLRGRFDTIGSLPPVPSPAFLGGAAEQGA